jgi:hypothetical protein
MSVITRWQREAKGATSVWRAEKGGWLRGNDWERFAGSPALWQGLGCPTPNSHFPGCSFGLSVLPHQFALPASPVLPSPPPVSLFLLAD